MRKTYNVDNSVEIYAVLFMLLCLFVFKLGFKLTYSLLAIHRQVLYAMHAELMKSPVDCYVDLQFVRYHNVSILHNKDVLINCKYLKL